MNRHLRRLRAIETRISKSQTRKKRQELDKEHERLQKMLPKLLWIARAPANNHLRIKSQGTYCRRLHGQL